MVGTRQGEVHVIDLATGKRKGNKRFGDAINGTPAVIGQTMAVPLAQGRRAVAAYNLDQASMRWRTRGAPVQVRDHTSGIRWNPCEHRRGSAAF